LTIGGAYLLAPPSPFPSRVLTTYQRPATHPLVAPTLVGLFVSRSQVPYWSPPTDTLAAARHVLIPFTTRTKCSWTAEDRQSSPGNIHFLHHELIPTRIFEDINREFVWQKNISATCALGLRSAASLPGKQKPQPHGQGFQVTPKYRDHLPIGTCTATGISLPGINT